MSLSESPPSVVEFFYTYVMEPQQNMQVMSTLKNVTAQTSEPASLSSNEIVSVSHISYPTIDEVNERIRRLLPPRGNRFRHDHLNTCMYIERSKNANVVAYTANLINKETQQRTEEKSGTSQCECVFDTKAPLHCYWIKLEPEHVARRRARGEVEDMCELNMLERKLAYGCTASPLPLNKLMHELNNMCKNRKSSISSRCQADNKISNISGEFTKTLQNCSCTDLSEESVKNSVNNNNNYHYHHYQRNNTTHNDNNNNDDYYNHHHYSLHQRSQNSNEHVRHHSSSSSSFHRIAYKSCSNNNKNNNNGTSNSSRNNSFSRVTFTSTGAGTATINNNNNSSNNNNNNSFTSFYDRDTRLAHWHTAFQPYVVKFVAMPHCPLLLILLPPLLSQPTCSTDYDYIPVMIGAHDGHLALLTSIFVKSIEPKHFYQLPSVEYIDIKGYSLQTGEALTHREYAS